MGPTLEETRRDLRYMPTQYLTQVAQSPNDRVIGDIPLKTLAGLELSRRAQMQNELAAMNAPNPQMPTVLASTVQSLSPQPQQGMMPPQQPQGMPPAPPPQQAAPQPQQPPAPPPQPQQQQQPPQAKQPPIMGLPAMQGPKKMAGGGIIAFNGEKDSEVPTTDETKIDEEEYRRLGMASMPNPRAKSAEKQAAMREAMGPGKVFGTKDTGSVPPAVKDDAKKPDGNPPIQNVPDPTSGIAALMKMVGGMGGGRGSGGSELSAAAKRLADFSERETPEQQAYRASALKRAQEFENYKSPAMSEAQREAFIDEKFRKNQEYSKPHFDMMQKLIDEEKAANNAGKDSEFYKMLGKVGGTLMSSRGAFGPALGRAVSEGIDYSDRADAARAAAERLRRQAQMDLLKARMLDEKGDRQGALTELANHDRALKDAAKFDLDAKKASTEMLKDVAGSDTKRQIEGAKLSNAFDIAGMRNQHALEKAGFARDLALAKYGAQLDASRLKGLPTIAEHYKMQEQADALFANPFQGRAAVYLSNVGPEGKNAIRKVEMMGMKPQEALKDSAVASAVEKAKAAYINDVLRSTNRVNASSSSVRDYNDYAASIGVR